jgi:hypothetical protein
MFASEGTGAMAAHIGAQASAQSRWAVLSPQPGSTGAPAVMNGVAQAKAADVAPAV